MWKSINSKWHDVFLWKNSWWCRYQTFNRSLMNIGSDNPILTWHPGLCFHQPGEGLVLLPLMWTHTPAAVGQIGIDRSQDQAWRDTISYGWKDVDTHPHWCNRSMIQRFSHKLLDCMNFLKYCSCRGKMLIIKEKRKVFTWRRSITYGFMSKKWYKHHSRCVH